MNNLLFCLRLQKSDDKRFSKRVNVVVSEKCKSVKSPKGPLGNAVLLNRFEVASRREPGFVEILVNGLKIFASCWSSGVKTFEVKCGLVWVI